MPTALENAHTLYMEGIRDGRPREALAKCVGARYTQHSSGVADGPEGFLEFFDPFLERNPKRDMNIVRSFQDGYFVFVHCLQILNDGAAKWVTMDIFGSDEHGRIVEHWDVIVPYVEPAPGVRTMVDGPSEIHDLDKTEANKTTVRGYLREVLDEGRLDRMDQYVSREVIEHVPGRADGLDGARASLTASPVRYDYRFKVIGSGNFVASLCRSQLDGKAHAVMDLFRLAGGRIVEHWMAQEPILPKDQWNNVGKF